MTRETKLREIQPCTFTIKAWSVEAPLPDNPGDWLAAQARELKLEWLLAHAADGVTWGRYVDDQLILSSQAFPDISPGLHGTILQQARLFGPKAELLVWRSGKGWQARLLADDSSQEGQRYDGWRYDEAQWLWGDHQETNSSQFTLVADGEQGLRHAVPLTDIPFDPSDVKRERWHPLRLGVRQYLAQQPDCRLTVIQGRLTDLRSEARKEETR